MALPSFNFLYITAGQGRTGTTGQQLADSWETNFDLLKNLLMSLDEDVQARIISHEIQEIKVENGIAYFTTDNGETWVSLGPSFANITGRPEDCPALVAKFANYVTVSTFNNTLSRISTLENNFVILDGTVSNMGLDVETLKSQMNDNTDGVLVRLTTVETSLDNKISSTSVAEIRQNSTSTEVDGEIVTEYFLEYRIKGQTDWAPVSGTPVVEWGQIVGNINENEQLMNKFDEILDAISDIESVITTIQNNISELQGRMTTAEESISNHINDTNNPHQVTASQLGLGNVDNTSDANKPVSGPQHDFIQQEDETLSLDIRTEMYTKFKDEITVVALDHEAYEDLETFPAGTDYDNLPATQDITETDPVTGETITVTVPIDYSGYLFENKVYMITDKDQ